MAVFSMVVFSMKPLSVLASSVHHYGFKEMAQFVKFKVQICDKLYYYDTMHDESSFLQ